ncbi:serine kinase [Jiulongibacter sp. NS-SX5]|uniref:serine kinase n=1 Tax=Jiulongibacter sp. NS-SX5 TaxID=3463854 RepID=UPI00405A456F
MKFKAFGQTILTDLDLSNLLPLSSENDFSIEIRDGEIEIPNTEKTQVFRKNIQAEIAFKDDKVLLYWPGLVVFAITDSLIKYRVLIDEIETFKLFLISEALGICLFLKGYFVLHASAVKINHKAHVFLGEPGAGKSTTATAFWQSGQTVLSDDLVVLKKTDGKWFVSPAYPHFKVWKKALIGLGIDYSHLPPSFEGGDKFLVSQPFDSFSDQPVELSAINILNLFESGAVPSFKAPIELLKHFPLPNQLLKGEQTKNHFLQSSNLASKVAMNFIQRPEGFDNLQNYVRSYAAE